LTLIRKSVFAVSANFISGISVLISVTGLFATYNMQKVFLKYGNNIESSKQLTDIIEYTFFYM